MTRTLEDTERELAESKDRLCHAFLAGAKWWEWKKTNATMWQSDQNEVFTEALNRYPFLSFLESDLRIQLDRANVLNAQQAERIKELERDALLAYAKYIELVDALCSKAWRGRDRHSSVLALASRLKARQKTIVPLELEDVALAAGYCIRESGHSGPCNGLARNDCFVSEQALTAKEPKA